MTNVNEKEAQTNKTYIKTYTPDPSYGVHGWGQEHTHKKTQPHPICPAERVYTQKAGDNGVEGEKKRSYWSCGPIDFFSDPNFLSKEQNNIINN